MFGFFGFFLIIILIILIIGLAIVGNIVAAVLRIFGIGRRGGNKQRETYTKSGNSQYNDTSSNSNQSNNQSGSSEHKGKIIGDDEGDYVDFEEIK